MAPPVGGVCQLLVGLLSAVSCASFVGPPDNHPDNQPGSHPIMDAKQASTQTTTTQANSAGIACGEQCSCQQHTLSCAGGHDGTLLTEVPTIEGYNDTFFYVDFSGNTIPEVHKRSWLTYSWTETLILKDNHLQKLEKDSFEGLLLLKHLCSTSGHCIVGVTPSLFRYLWLVGQPQRRHGPHRRHSWGSRI